MAKYVLIYWALLAVGFEGLLLREACSRTGSAPFAASLRYAPIHRNENPFADKKNGKSSLESIFAKLRQFDEETTKRCPCPLLSSSPSPPRMPETGKTAHLPSHLTYLFAVSISAIPTDRAPPLGSSFP